MKTPLHACFLSLLLLTFPVFHTALPAAEVAPDGPSHYVFSGGYKIGEHAQVLLRIKERSVWLRPGQRFGDVLLQSVSEDFQSVTLLVGADEIHS